jgi:methyl-accepting chemotaxis protein
MKIKTKVSLGIFILAALIIAQGIVFNIFIYKFSDASDRILKDNYTSLVYGKEMLDALDKMHESFLLTKLDGVPESKGSKIDWAESKRLFESRLSSEENNITEKGERELVGTLKSDYEKYLIHLSNSNNILAHGSENYLPKLALLQGQVRKDIVGIMNVNMHAITVKNDLAKATSKQAILYTSILEVLALFITLPVLFLFPSYIANPIREIKDRIREIANRNYNQKIAIHRRDEIGELAEEFNKMTDKLGRQHPAA